MRYSAGVEVSDLLGGDRGRIEAELSQSILDAAERRNLGVDIVFVGLQGVHPPSETAEAFQDVIGAVSKAEASVRSAGAEYNKRLAEVAGDVGRAEDLAPAIRELNRLQAGPDSSAEALAGIRERTHRLFFGDASRNVRPIGGLAAERVSQAREERWRLENEAHGKATAFGAEIETYEAAPLVYRMRKYLETLLEGTQGKRIYVTATAEGSRAVGSYQINLQDPRDIEIGVGLGQEEQ
jgi:regulator of protease activity HflC (stomatin/prohibitin superfamily)